jgi:hypothetical protein
MTARANLYIDQGTDFSADLELFSDGGEDLPISNYTFRGDAKKVFSSSGPVFEFDVSYVPSTINRVEIRLGADSLTGIEPGKYQYDIVMISPADVRTKILEGLVFIVATITDTSA